MLLFSLFILSVWILGLLAIALIRKPVPVSKSTSSSKLVPGSFWIEGTTLRYVDEMGTPRTLEGRL